LDDAEIVIDEWPWIDPYIEIEGEDEASVRAAAEQLGLDWSEAEFGHIDAVYEKKYEFTDGIRGVIDIHEVRFGDPVPAEFILRS
jgi:adenylate cyclase class 2